MPSCREYSERYTSRPSPPFNARHFASGSSKKGNDGKTYIVSRPSVNGVKRWVKKSSVKKRKTRNGTTATPLRRMYPRPVHRSGHLESARASEQRRIANAQRAAALRIRPSGSAVTQLPPRRLPPLRMQSTSRGTQVRLTVADDEYSNEHYSKIVTAVYSRPSHQNWIFYDREEGGEFRLPSFPNQYGDGGIGGNNYMAEFDVDMALSKGAIVWIVDYIPDPFQQ